MNCDALIVILCGWSVTVFLFERDIYKNSGQVLRIKTTIVLRLELNSKGHGGVDHAMLSVVWRKKLGEISEYFLLNYSKNFSCTTSSALPPVS